jgi:hypothetical protein
VNGVELVLFLPLNPPVVVVMNVTVIARRADVVSLPLTREMVRSAILVTGNARDLCLRSRQRRQPVIAHVLEIASFADVLQSPVRMVIDRNVAMDSVSAQLSKDNQVLLKRTTSGVEVLVPMFLHNAPPQHRQFWLILVPNSNSRKDLSSRLKPKPLPRVVTGPIHLVVLGRLIRLKEKGRSRKGVSLLPPNGKLSRRRPERRKQLMKPKKRLLKPGRLLLERTLIRQDEDPGRLTTVVHLPTPRRRSPQRERKLLRRRVPTIGGPERSSPNSHPSRRVRLTDGL